MPTVEQQTVNMIVKAQAAAIESVERAYRMPAVRDRARPGRVFNHIAERDAHLSLCRGLAITRPDTHPLLTLALVDCQTCLDEFAKRLVTGR